MSKIKVKGKHVILSLVCLVLGFMIAFSYHLTQIEKEEEKPSVSGSQWEKTLALRNQLIAEEKSNRELQKELNQKQEKVLKNEKDLSKEAQGVRPLPNSMIRSWRQNLSTVL